MKGRWWGGHVSHTLDFPSANALRKLGFFFPGLDRWLWEREVGKGDEMSFLIVGIGGDGSV